MKRTARINAESNLDNIQHITAALTMTVRDKVVNCYIGEATYAVTLPPVSEAAGMFFSIKNIDCTDAVTVQDNDESVHYDGDYTLTTTGDCILLYSDGESWYAAATLT